MLYDDLPGSNPYPYRQLIAETPRLTEEQKQALIDRLSEDYDGYGCQAARETLLLDTLSYIDFWTHKYLHVYDCFRLEHADVVHMACVFFLERLSDALSKDAPIAWIMGMTKWAIRVHCLKHASTIDRQRVSNDDPPLVVLSLDAPLPEHPETTLADLLVDPSTETTPDQPARDYEPLYQAIQFLPPKQSETIQRYYGLNGYPGESLSKIRPNHSANCLQSEGYKRLRACLSLEKGALSVDASAAVYTGEAYTSAQLCSVLGISPNTVSRFAKRHGIQSAGYGRYSKEDVDRVAATTPRSSRWGGHAYAAV